jgi:F-type H+-transporting ATPase subunit epsilon
MYRQGEQRRYLSIFWGYMEVNNDKVTMLAEVAEPAAEIDRARAEAARDRAEERLRRFQDQTIDRERAREALERAVIRLGVLSKGH